MLAQRLPSILPPLSPRELLEVSMIQSVAGQLANGALSNRRPFRAPHHSASMAALVGGGSIMSAAATDGTSMTRSIRSRSGPERRTWYCAMQRSFGCRRQAKPGSVAWPQRHGFMAATSWKRAG